jgi:DNA-binding beta-propeller fold protein YncE
MQVQPLRAIVALFLIALAGCAGTGTGAPAAAVVSPAYNTPARHGWLSPAAKTKPVIYVSDNTANAIQIYPQGQSDPAPIGEITDGISAPLGNFVDAKGTLYVANHGNNTVTEYPKGQMSPSVTLSSGISGPISVAVDRKGDVAVGEFTSATILEFPAGSSTPSVTITLLTYPEALTFDRSGHLYAAWNANTGSGLTGHVSKCEHMRAVCADRGITEGESGGLVLDKTGNLVLGDQTNAALNIYAPGAISPTRTIPTSGADPYKFELDKAQKTLYVADINHGVIVVYDYATGGQLGTISNGLQSAWGVSLSPAAKYGP